MLMTEKQASESWCPMVRIARIEQPEGATREIVVAGCNTDALGRNRVPASCRCVASGCAMWRWEPGFPRQKFHQATGDNAALGEDDPEPSRPAGVPATWEWFPHVESWAGWLEPQDEANTRRQGYCGLAGMPVAVAKEVSEAAR